MKATDTQIGGLPMNDATDIKATNRKWDELTLSEVNRLINDMFRYVHADDPVCRQELYDFAAAIQHVLLEKNS